MLVTSGTVTHTTSATLTLAGPAASTAKLDRRWLIAAAVLAALLLTAVATRLRTVAHAQRL
jgi:hypothetical protein